MVPYHTRSLKFRVIVVVLSGVPQGSVIGSFLFILYINVLPEILRNTTELYADDSKIMLNITSYKTGLSLQSDLDTVFKWTEDWLLKFNIDKLLVMYYGFNKKDFPLFINVQELKSRV